MIEERDFRRVQECLVNEKKQIVVRTRLAKWSEERWIIMWSRFGKTWGWICS